MAWVVALFGFPIAVVLAWAFEVTPEGVRWPSFRSRSRAVREPNRVRNRNAGTAVNGWVATASAVFDCKYLG